MGKGGDELARDRIPELGGFVRARCQDPSAIRTKCHACNLTLMSKRGDELARGRIPELAQFCPRLPSGSERRPD